MKLILLVFLITFCTPGCHKVEMESGESLWHYAYVWNRTYTQSLNNNIEIYGQDLKGYSVLASELTFGKDKLSTAKAEIPLNHPSIDSIAIRINDFSGPISDRTEDIINQTEAALARFVKKQFKITEIQIDYDCPESKLSQYSELLKVLRKKFSKKITITALPSWLNNDSFKEVLKNCDNYVLQLHSLTKPKSIHYIPKLFDREQANEWLHEAARLEKPFSISLPTYGYYLGFGESGEYLGISSEQGPKNWPETKVLLSDYTEISNFIDSLKNEKPKLLRSVYWFRMQHQKDILNWDFKAVKNIIDGVKQDTQNSEIVFEESTPGLVDISIKNGSPFPMQIPHKLPLSVSVKEILMAEAFKEFTLLQGDKNLTISVRKSIVLAPGDQISLCWVRFKNNQTGKISDAR